MRSYIEYEAKLYLAKFISCSDIIYSRFLFFFVPNTFFIRNAVLNAPRQFKKRSNRLLVICPVLDESNQQL